MPLIIVIAILGSVMDLQIALHLPGFPFAPDSVSYIEQASNLVQEGYALDTSWGIYSLELFPTLS